ncbi:hypothetical protein CAAU_1504 [Caloramator australicus RC3]|uniref:Uncharacterized protein n=2 Tax=Clostridiaceae TaxID=31979 RepID=I7KUI6_9CLOT|nr:hypothetical protein CAAU_1504 [Caloramator australicus RC3]
MEGDKDMYTVLSIFDDKSVDAYVLPKYDVEIIRFIEEANKHCNGIGIIVVEGEYASTNMRISEFRNVSDIIDIYSFLEHQDDDTSFVLFYKEICNYINEIYKK